MLMKYNRLIDLNKKYTKDLAKWAENSENLNDDTLLKMLNHLMTEYEADASVLLEKLRFDMEMYRKRRKFAKKSERAELASEIKKTKFQIKKKKKLNKRLYVLFKKKLRLEYNNTYKKEEIEMNEYFSKLKAEANEIIDKKVQKEPKTDEKSVKFQSEDLEKADLESIEPIESVDNSQQVQELSEKKEEGDNTNESIQDNN